MDQEWCDHCMAFTMIQCVLQFEPTVTRLELYHVIRLKFNDSQLIAFEALKRPTFTTKEWIRQIVGCKPSLSLLLEVVSGILKLDTIIFKSHL